MLGELLGFTLSRTLPDSTLLGVISGEYKVFGGVVRDNAGKIVAHLLDGAGPSASLLASPILGPLNLAATGVNTFQLHTIGANVSQLLLLTKGTMLLSGLTLGVCTAGFIFLNGKLKAIDEKLKVMSRDTKAIKTFLEHQEHARVVTALKNLRSVQQPTDSDTQRQLLISSRQTLGEIHEKYRSALISCDSIEEIHAIEEYYTITALGHALACAELGMFNQAKADLTEAYEIWSAETRRILNDLIIRDEPERFLEKKYAKQMKTVEIALLMDYALQESRGLDWIDEFRNKPPIISLLTKSIKKEEILEIELSRRIIGRNNVLQGYVSQYAYYEQIEVRPSEVHDFVAGLPREEAVDECFVFTAEA